MGKAEENKKLKRAALLSHAFSLFMNQGVADTTISDITSHAGVGKGTFYFYFKDKEDLIERLIAQKAEQLFSHALQELEKQGDLSVEDSLVFIANDLVEQLIEDSKLLKFLNKRLNYGLYAQSLLREDVVVEFDIIGNFYTLIEKNDEEWKDPLLMLYTITEFTTSTCHSIILEQKPVDFAYYKPYLDACIRNIIQVFRK